MTTISIINLKGGVAKTISSINLAHILATVHNKRVLLIDNDKQGNTSKFFNLYGYDDKSISELLIKHNMPTEQVIKHTQYKKLDVITANMDLLKASNMLTADSSVGREYRLKKALQQVEDNYDYCIIDNAPDLNVSVINALVATDDVLIPIKVDNFAFDGVDVITEQVENIKTANSKIRIAGCFITMYQRNNVNTQGSEFLCESAKYPMFKTHIRKTVRVDETTFNKIPLLDYAKNSTAAHDYIKLVDEYLTLNVSETDTN